MWENETKKKRLLIVQYIFLKRQTGKMYEIDSKWVIGQKKEKEGRNEAILVTNDKSTQNKGKLIQTQTNKQKKQRNTKRSITFVVKK